MIKYFSKLSLNRQLNLNQKILHYFTNNQIKHHIYDAVVVGSGVAGLRATLGLVENGYKTACLTKENNIIQKQDPLIIQEGINAALEEQDDWRYHCYDTIKRGEWIGDQNAIHYMCREAPKLIQELQDYGVQFKMDQDGKIQQLYTGLQSLKFSQGGRANRYCVTEDLMTEDNIKEILFQNIQQKNEEKCNFFEEYFALDLIMDDKGECRGIIALSKKDKQIHVIQANHTIIATGGYNSVFKSNTRGVNCTGDGAAMVARAGLSIQDPEFVQFHATSLYGTNIKISELYRSEIGGILRNTDGEQFMERYAPVAKDWASNVILTRAMHHQLQEGKGVGSKKDHFNLHLDHVPKEIIQENYPQIIELACKNNIDIDLQPIPITPGVSFSIGGIPTNWKSQVVTLEQEGNKKIVPGLYSVGEAACVSVHGSNIIEGNGLLETLAFGKQVVNTITQTGLKESKQLNVDYNNIGGKVLNKLDQMKNNEQEQEKINLECVKESIQNIMEEHVGIVRTENSLIKENSYLIIQTALYRRETRGNHIREDYLEDYTWKHREQYNKHIMAQMSLKTGKLEMQEYDVIYETLDEQEFQSQLRHIKFY